MSNDTNRHMQLTNLLFQRVLELGNILSSPHPHGEIIRGTRNQSVLYRHIFKANKENLISRSERNHMLTYLHTCRYDLILCRQKTLFNCN